MYFYNHASIRKFPENDVSPAHVETVQFGIAQILGNFMKLSKCMLHALKIFTRTPEKWHHDDRCAR